MHDSLRRCGRAASSKLAKEGSVGEEQRRRFYLGVERALKTVRASGFFGDQSSGGKATRQKLGRGAANSSPTSALPLRTGPRNTTWHSCSSCVHLCCRRTVLPLVTRASRS